MPGSRVAPEDGDTVIPVADLEVSDVLDDLNGAQVPRPASATIRNGPALSPGAVAGGRIRSLPLTMFPEEARDELRFFDTNGDNMLDVAEIVAGTRILQQAKKAAEAGSFSLSLFPEDARAKLAEFDDNGDDTIDVGEILAGCAALKQAREAAKNGSFPLCLFPPDAAAKLKEFDQDGDDTIDAKEILAGCAALKREREQSKRLMWIIAGLLLLVLILFVGMGIITWEVTSALKDSKMTGSVMVNKNTGEPIQTANSDMVRASIALF